MHSPLSRTTFAAIATAGALSAVAAAPAAADSVAYTKDGSVWLSTGDGSRQFQVTNGGGYSEVSQADDGRMIALHGDKLTLLSRQGAVLADFATPVSTSTDPSMQFKGPFDPVISPDGSRVAYTYYWQYIGEDPYCRPSMGCYVKRLYHGIAFTASDRLTAWDEVGRRQSGWIHPFWVGNDKVFASDPSVAPNEDMVMIDPDKDKNAGFTRWFSQPGAKAWRDADMTRSQRKLAGITGDADDKIWFANVNGLPENGGKPNYPTPCAYEINEPDGGKFGTVSWAPSGTTLAYSDGSGIHTIAIPEFGAGAGDCGNPTEQPKLLVAGAQSPSWGPADVPPARAVPTPTPTPGTPTPAPTTKPTPTPKPGDGGIVIGGDTGNGGIVLGGNTGGGSTSGGSTLTLAKALSAGLPITVVARRAGTLTVTATAKGKKVASGTAKPKKPGNTAVKLTFTKAARTSLATSSSVTLTITATLKPKTGKATKSTAKVTLGG